MKPIKSIGFVGLGMMGLPMAARLRDAGFETFVSDSNAARVAAWQGGDTSQKLTVETARSVDALVTMLPNSAIVEEALLGEAGWARLLPLESFVIDMSSSEPGRSRALGEILGQMGVHYIDAPVSGGVKRAQQGTLAILCGGAAQALEQCRALLSTMGKDIIHIGSAGSGHAAKALNNYVSAAGLLATVEALHVARSFGIDPQVMTDVLNASSGRTNTSENKVQQFMLSGTFSSGFALQLMNKDVKIAIALAEQQGYPMTLGKACGGLWDSVSKLATPATDHTRMYQLLYETDG